MESPTDGDDGFDCCYCCASVRLRNALLTALIGQILSVCMCASGVTAKYLSSPYTFDAPTAQSFTVYFFLMIVYGSVLAFRSKDPNLIEIFRLRGWKYLILTIIDVEATCLMVSAYHYTSVANVQLLDCFTIPVVLLLSFAFLKVRYLMIHIIGVGICIVGVVCLVWGDIQLGYQLTDGSNRLRGDFMCLSGAALYGISNVVQEWLLKHHERIEYLAMLGIFGSFVSGIQLAALETEKIGAARWDLYPTFILMIAYALSLFLFYSLVSVMIKRSSAIMFNLHILTADFYALLCSHYLFGDEFHLLFLVSFALVVCGTIVYSWKETSTREGRASPNPIDEACRLSAINCNPVTVCPIHGTVMNEKPTDQPQSL